VVRNNLLLVPILSQMNPAHTFPSFSFRIDFNFIIQFTLKSSYLSLFPGVSYQNVPSNHSLSQIVGLWSSAFGKGSRDHILRWVQSGLWDPPASGPMDC
jgi:hypothetical protein